MKSIKWLTSPSFVWKLFLLCLFFKTEKVGKKSKTYKIGENFSLSAAFLVSKEKSWKLKNVGPNFPFFSKQIPQSIFFSNHDTYTTIFKVKISYKARFRTLWEYQCFFYYFYLLQSTTILYKYVV